MDKCITLLKFKLGRFTCWYLCDIIFLCMNLKCGDNLKKTEEIQVKKKYKLSMTIDIIFMFLILLVSFILWGIFSSETLDFFSIIFVIVVPGYHFFSDKLFRNQSLGKRVMNIKIISTNGDEVPPLAMIIKRRWLEWRNYDRSLFSKKRYNIEQITATKIVKAK